VWFLGLVHPSVGLCGSGAGLRRQLLVRRVHRGLDAGDPVEVVAAPLS
jgi:hypothetical protein